LRDYGFRQVQYESLGEAGMNCPKCDGRTDVFDSRPGPRQDKGPSVWRRRRCRACKIELSTYERIAEDDTVVQLKRRLKRTQKLVQTVAEAFV
jgi:transcriptional regulator NrdR family protein